MHDLQQHFQCFFIVGRQHLAQAIADVPYALLEFERFPLRIEYECKEFRVGKIRVNGPNILCNPFRQRPRKNIFEWFHLYFLFPQK